MRQAHGVMSNSTFPMLQLKVSYDGIAGEDPNVQLTGTTLMVEPTGGTGSKVLATITQSRVDGDGDALADVTYEFYGAAAADEDLGACLSIKDIVDQINDNGPDGMIARIAHAPQDASLNSDDFVALSATAIPANGTWYDCLYRDVENYKHSSDLVFWMRLGIPDLSDRGRIRLGGISGSCTGVASGVITLYRDEPGEDEEQILAPTTLVEAETNYLNLDTDKSWSVRGPLILEVKASDLTAADYRIRYQTGEW